MSFIALIFALTLSYYLPRSQPQKLKRLFLRLAHYLAISKVTRLKQQKKAILIWWLMALLPAIAVGAAFYFFNSVLPLLGLLLNVIVLYFTLTFSDIFNKPVQIVEALRANNNALANHLYREFAPNDKEALHNLSDTDIARKSIEVSLLRGHYQWFAPIFWFVVLSSIGLGVAGVVLYRLTDVLAHDAPQSAMQSTMQSTVLGKLFAWFDALPAYFSAWGFAIMGDFEDALYCWREQANAWAKANSNSDSSQYLAYKNKGILLSTGAGALGVKLRSVDAVATVNDEMQAAQYKAHLEIGLGDDADADYLHSAIGLVWRVLILMLSLLLLFTCAYWLGN